MYYDRFEYTIRNLNNTIDSLQKELDVKQNRINELNTELSRVKKRNETLWKELNKTQKQLRVVTAEGDELIEKLDRKLFDVRNELRYVKDKYGINE